MWPPPAWLNVLLRYFLPVQNAKINNSHPVAIGKFFWFLLDVYIGMIFRSGGIRINTRWRRQFRLRDRTSSTSSSRSRTHYWICQSFHEKGKQFFLTVISEVWTQTNIGTFHSIFNGGWGFPLWIVLVNMCMSILKSIWLKLSVIHNGKVTSIGKFWPLLNVFCSPHLTFACIPFILTLMWSVKKMYPLNYFHYVCFSPLICKSNNLRYCRVPPRNLLCLNWNVNIMYISFRLELFTFWFFENIPPLRASPLYSTVDGSRQGVFWLVGKKKIKNANWPMSEEKEN